MTPRAHCCMSFIKLWTVDRVTKLLLAYCAAAVAVELINHNSVVAVFVSSDANYL